MGIPRFRIALFVLLCAVNAPDRALAGAHIVAPAQGTTVFGSSLPLEIKNSARQPPAAINLDGHEITVQWLKSPYRDRWFAHLPVSNGDHVLGLGKAKPIHFRVQDGGTRELAARLARNFISKNRPEKLAWDWGPAVFLYGLQKLQGFSDATHAYHEHWATEIVATPNRSDACASALSALELARTEHDWTGIASTFTVADYIRNEPRNRLGALNHLGHSFFSHFFADSIWVDSLMMVSVFATQWGSFMHDEALLEFGAQQPLIYASALQDGATGLFRHAYKIKSGKTIPLSETFWLRGNGWVLASIAEILDELPATSPRRAPLIAIFEKLASGLLPFQLENGLWDSVANLPGYTYPETSGTALVAYALAHGVHQGWLPLRFLEVAKTAFKGITARMPGDPVSLPGISGPTDPGPRYFYGLVRAKTDKDYGVGAFLLAAAELRNEGF